MADRQERMLELLLRAEGWTTAAALAERLDVTPRTVRSYVTALNAAEPFVESGPNGYRVDREAWARRASSADRTGPTTPHARVSRLLRELVDGEIAVHEAAARLHVSDSTLESDLSRVRARLNGTGLVLRRAGELAVLDGPESARRRLLGALFREESARGMLELEEIQREFPAEPLAAFKTALIAELLARGYEINEYGLRTVLLHVAIAVDRIGRDHRLAAGASAAPPGGELVALLDELVPAHFRVELGAGDLEYLAFLLTTRVATPATGPLTASAVDDYLSARQLDSVRRIVSKAAREYLVDLDDPDFLIRLALHVQNLVARASAQSYARNPLARSIKSSYPMIYELAVFIAGELQRIEGVAVNEDEIAYIAMHVGAQLEERHSGETTVAASIVSPSYHSLHLSLLRRLEDSVGQQLRVESVATRSDVDWAGLPGELVISAVEPPVPSDRVVVVNPFFGEADEDRVRQAIARVRRQRRRAQITDELLEYFEDGLFLRNQHARDPEGMIRRLGGLMVERGLVDDRYVEGAIERERLSSTAFTESLAVPHAMAMTARRTSIAIVLNETPMDWGENRVNVVAFIAFSEAGRASFQEVFEQFVEVFSDRENVQRLLRRAVDFPAFIAELAHLMAE